MNVFLDSNRHNLFRTVEQTWKNQTVWSQWSLKKIMTHFAHFPRPGENDSYVSALSPRPAENSSSAISGKADCRSPAEISSFPEDEFWPSKGGAVFRLGRAGLAWIAAIWHDPVPAIGCSPSGEFYQTDPDLSSMPTVIIFFFPIKSESNSGWGLGDYLWS